MCKIELNYEINERNEMIDIINKQNIDTIEENNENTSLIERNQDSNYREVYDEKHGIIPVIEKNNENINNEIINNEFEDSYSLNNRDSDYTDIETEDIIKTNEFIEKRVMDSVEENFDKNSKSNQNKDIENNKEIKSSDNNIETSKVSEMKTSYKEVKNECETELTESEAVFNDYINSIDTEMDTDFEDNNNTKDINRSDDLLRHKRSHREKTHICDFCSKGFSRSEYLINHFGVHKQEIADGLDVNHLIKITIKQSPEESGSVVKYLKCDVKGCNYKTNANSKESDRNFLRHKQRHVLRFYCQICGKRLADKYLLDQHLKERHEDLLKTYRTITCDYNSCGTVFKGFKRERNLLRHQESSHPEMFPNKKYFMCSKELCEFKSKSKETFEDHKRRHKRTLEKKYVCEWIGCEKRFATKHKSKVHMNSHTGHKPYVCVWPQCDYKTAKPDSLSKHRKIHKNIRKHVCDWPECDYRTVTKFNLDKHKAKHTGEKKFVCVWPECDYKTANQSNLITHSKKH